MNIVTDANVLISSLIKEGKSIEILLNPLFSFYSPEFANEEFLEHGEEIIEKTHRSGEDFIEIFSQLKEIINFVKVDFYKENLKEAANICSDKDDLDYFALALKLNCQIWSNDKRMKEQQRIRIYSTKDMAEEFNL